MNKRNVLLFVALILIFSSTNAQNSELKEASPASVKISAERLIRIDKMLQQSIDSGWIAGAVGFIARDGKIVYNKSFGVSDIETKHRWDRMIFFVLLHRQKQLPV